MSQGDIERYPLIYHIDIPRVQRILRPLSAKILGLQRELQSAPSAVSSKTSLNLSSDGGHEEQEVNMREVSPIAAKSRHISLSPAHQHLDPRIKYGRRCKRDAFKRYSLDNFHEPSCSNNIHESLEIRRGLTLPVLLRRHSDSIRDCVKDAVERLWWQPLLQNTLHMEGDLRSLKPPRMQSLAVTAAYALGGWIEENLGLLEGVAANEELERIFEEIPSHLRRHVVLEHIANLCKKRIPIVELLEPIVEIFAKFRANSQAFNLLSHILLSQLQPSHDITSVYESKFNVHQNGSRNIALAWMYSISRVIRSSDKFIHLLCSNLSLELVKRRRFFHFVTTMLHMRHAAPLIKIAANLILAELKRKVQGFRRLPSETNRALLQTFIIQRARLKSWMKLLIEHSTLLRAGRQVSKIATLCDEIILHMATDLMVVSKALPHIFGDMAMTACLHGFNLSSSPQRHDKMDSTMGWLRRIRELRIAYFAVPLLPSSISICSTHNGGEQQIISLSLIISSYKSLTCLYKLSKLLETNGEYELCERLLKEIIADYEVLRQNDVTLEQQSSLVTYAITMRDLEHMISNIESLTVTNDTDKVGEWQYEPGLEEWVLLKPHSELLVPNKRMSSTEFGMLTSNQLPITRNLNSKRRKCEVQLERGYRASQQLDDQHIDHGCDDNDHIFDFCDPVKMTWLF